MEPNNPKTQKQYVIELQHGKLTKQEFITYLESKVFKTINRFKLIDRNDKICVAASGGKDSLTVLYLIKKYMEKYNIPTKNLQALAINEGIADYRDQTLEDLKEFTNKHNIPLTIASFKENFNKTLDEAYPIINKLTKKKPCNICGVWRRTLLNTYAKKLGATKLATGHNLDDEAQAILMNQFKANTKLAAKLGPVSGIDKHEGFIQRIKPLYLCSEKETRLYTYLLNFKVNYTECPNVTLSYRSEIRDMLNNFEQKYPGTKNGIIQSFLDILPTLKEKQISENKDSSSAPRQCQICREPSNNDTCNSCNLKNLITTKKKETNS